MATLLVAGGTRIGVPDRDRRQAFSGTQGLSSSLPLRHKLIVVMMLRPRPDVVGLATRILRLNSGLARSAQDLGWNRRPVPWHLFVRDCKARARLAADPEIVLVTILRLGILQRRDLHGRGQALGLGAHVIPGRRHQPRSRLADSALRFQTAFNFAARQASPVDLDSRVSFSNCSKLLACG